MRNFGFISGYKEAEALPGLDARQAYRRKLVADARRQIAESDANEKARQERYAASAAQRKAQAEARRTRPPVADIPPMSAEQQKAMYELNRGIDPDKIFNQPTPAARTTALSSAPTATAKAPTVQDFIQRQISTYAQPSRFGVGFQQGRLTPMMTDPTTVPTDPVDTGDSAARFTGATQRRPVDLQYATQSPYARSLSAASPPAPTPPPAPLVNPANVRAPSPIPVDIPASIASQFMFGGNARPNPPQPGDQPLQYRITYPKAFGLRPEQQQRLRRRAGPQLGDNSLEIL
jgi:hypothetical protein